MLCFVGFVKFMWSNSTKKLSYLSDISKPIKIIGGKMFVENTSSVFLSKGYHCLFMLAINYGASLYHGFLVL